MSRQHAQHVSPNVESFPVEIENWRTSSSQWRKNLRRLWCGKQLALRAVTATKESFAPYGQLITESMDGDLYNEVDDGVLDLSAGKPRLYFMKLEGGRPLLASNITCHKHVTQCLGALGTDKDFYLVVHVPGDLSFAGLKAFRIPPRHYVKLDRGTWHLGPMWTGEEDSMTFINLELTDTNDVDHTCVQFCDIFEKGVDGYTPPPITIPVYPADDFTD
jgi:ureidoglycolate lyase